ncbi:hypothetical protein WSK_2894 [Novosphingobium sp. Rr 2-17]|nr:hypothetical protein WSK_2894 [Novosphingobium sp. Rr 2-17]
MMACELTERPPAATTSSMMHGGREARRFGTRSGWRATRAAKWIGSVIVGLSAMGLAGCIQVTAPDKPIVIELNINIRQEVVYRLAADAAKTVEENKGIF